MPGKLGLSALGVIVAGVLTGVAGAGPASAAEQASAGPASAGPASAAAAPWHHLCVDLFNDPNGSGVYCAFPLGVNLVIGAEETVQFGNPATNLTNWSFYFSNGSLGPFTNGTTGMIKQANVNLCMQLDHADGDLVRGAACNNDTAEQWKDVYDPTDRRTWFESVWAANNEKATKCLTWSGGGNGDAYIDFCSDSSTDGWGSS